MILINDPWRVTLYELPHLNLNMLATMCKVTSLTLECLSWQPHSCSINCHSNLRLILQPWIVAAHASVCVFVMCCICVETTDVIIHTLWLFIYSLDKFKATFSVHFMTFLTFHNKSHNMKALVIFNHSWSLFLKFLCGILEYFLEKKLSPDYLCKSHEHDCRWEDLIMAWLP